jgi:phosphonopyruvate decarboxylase
MINSEDFYNVLVENNIEFFAGVPDSLLKSICAYISDNCPTNQNIITANEGGAIALGVGYNLATNKIPLIYMQNSGIGNAVNPLLSLADKEVYSIPMILMIGWRGEPGYKDEPQHIKQGRVTPSLLQSMEIPYYIIDENSAFKEIIKESILDAKKRSSPVALLIRNNTFASTSLSKKECTKSDMSREKALELILKFIPENSLIVSTTGMLSRELFEIREKNNQSHKCDFLTVGSMGHTSQIALGIAMNSPDRQVYCFDGDGSALMHLGSYAIIGNVAPKNLKLIIFNNGAHDSVGGQPTVCENLDFFSIAKSFGLKSFKTIFKADDIINRFEKFVAHKHIALIEINVKKGSRKDLGRPTSSPLDNKSIFMEHLKE